MVSSLTDLNLPGILLARVLLERYYRQEIIQECHPLFFQRLSGDLNKTEYNTSYISDLGLRRTDEPTRFFLDNAVKCIGYDNADFINPLTHHDSTVNSLFKSLGLDIVTTKFDFEDFTNRHIADPVILNNVIKYYVDVLGNWQDADALAHCVFANLEKLPINELSAQLVSNCANLFAHKGDLKCKIMYMKAYALWENHYQKFSSIFRMAVASIKRVDSENVDGWLALSDEVALNFGEQTNNSLNTLFCRALIKNLEALYWLKQKNMDKTGACISEAFKVVSEIDVSKLDIQMNISNRYIVQIVENFGMYSGLASKWESAIPVMRSVLEISRKSHKESVPESLAFLGYALCKANRMSDALPILLEAESLFSESVWIDKVIQVRKMLVVAYDELGDDIEVDRWLNKISNLYS